MILAGSLKTKLNSSFSGMPHFRTAVSRSTKLISLNGGLRMSEGFVEEIGVTPEEHSFPLISSN